MAPPDREMVITVIKVFFSEKSRRQGEGRMQGGMRLDQFALIFDDVSSCVGVFYSF